MPSTVASHTAPNQAHYYYYSIYIYILLQQSDTIVEEQPQKKVFEKVFERKVFWAHQKQKKGVNSEQDIKLSPPNRSLAKVILLSFVYLAGYVYWLFRPTKR